MINRECMHFMPSLENMFMYYTVNGKNKFCSGFRKSSNE